VFGLKERGQNRYHSRPRFGPDPSFEIRKYFGQKVSSLLLECPKEQLVHVEGWSLDHGFEVSP